MKYLRTIVLSLFLALSLSLNVATVAVSSVAGVVSTVFEAVTGTRSVYSSLRHRNTGLAADLATSRQATAKLSSDLDATQGKLAKSTAELNAANQKAARLTAELKNPKIDYRGERKLVRDAVSDTVKRVSRRTTIAAGRNVSAIFAESLPLIGVGVAVAVTGYEIKDGCDNLRDLHELEQALTPRSEGTQQEGWTCQLPEVPTKEEVWSAIKSSPGDAWAGVSRQLPELGSMPELPAFWTVVTSTGEGVWERLFD